MAPNCELHVLVDYFTTDTKFKVIYYKEQPGKVSELWLALTSELLKEWCFTADTE